MLPFTGSNQNDWRDFAPRPAVSVVSRPGWSTVGVGRLSAAIATSGLLVTKSVTTCLRGAACGVSILAASRRTSLVAMRFDAGDGVGATAQASSSEASVTPPSSRAAAPHQRVGSAPMGTRSCLAQKGEYVMVDGPACPGTRLNVQAINVMNLHHGRGLLEGT
jgi:hypothetical protein